MPYKSSSYRSTPKPYGHTSTFKPYTSQTSTNIPSHTEKVIPSTTSQFTSSHVPVSNGHSTTPQFTSSHTPVSSGSSSFLPNWYWYWLGSTTHRTSSNLQNPSIPSEKEKVPEKKPWIDKDYLENLLKKFDSKKMYSDNFV